MQKYQCSVCSHIYDPAEGDPDSDIPPGTAFEDLPEDWSCPVYGAKKHSLHHCSKTLEQLLTTHNIKRI